MKTKEEVIKEAWGSLWSNFNKTAKECALKHNGFITPILENNLLQDFTYWSDESKAWRPKSLQGIENNNGWIKIESNDDLPKEYTYCFVFINGKVLTDRYSSILEDFLNKRKDEVTHYQPIKIPKPPVY